MREIKFRAWENGVMYYQVSAGGMFDGIATSPTCWCEKRKEWVNLIGGTHTKVMQYTNLKDKNGVEIWEGDIIESGYLNPLTGDFLSRKYVVEYDKDSFMGKLIGHTPYGDTFLRFINGEVIGNIYEDKYLLKEK